MPFKFHGGVHPNYMKAPDVPVTVIAPPPQVVLPMMQHIGAPCKPLVAVGDYVKMGQKIADNPAPVSAPIHATVSGKVIAIEPRPHPLGDMIPAIVIENDFQDTPCTDLAPLTPEQMKDPEAILDRIREAGIVGHGGAMFPTAFKIRGGLGKVDTLIINGAECEPYLNGDHLTMKNHPEELLKGIELARIASGLDKAYYGIEKNKQDAIDLLLSKNPAQYGVEIVPENVKYPQGAEKMQIKAITNREVKPGGLPSGVGCNVISTQTAYAIYRACYEGMPSIERVLTVAGSAMGDKSYNLQCRFGTPFSYIVEQCGGFVVEPKKIVLGGPMMGRMVDNADAFAKEVVTKTSGGLIILPRGHYLHRNATTPLNFMRRRAASACIQCRSCSELCPRHLLGHPFETHRVMRAFGSNAELTAEAGRLALLCCDCGVCEHVACPMGLSPRRINQAIKNELRAAGMKYEGSRDVNEAYTQWREFRRVPVPRLVNKIGISRYMELPTNDLGALSPAEVRIPLRQHIGAPAQAVVKAGDRVKCGDVIGEIPEQGLGARIHASMDGVVKSVDGAVVIGK